MPGPLQGVRIMDVGTAGVGPWAATLLGYLGAEVLKIESPAGDRHLYQPPLQRGLSTTYTSLNLNKRAAVLDLKDPELRSAVERLIRQADVIMDNLRPGVVDRMGVGYQAARQITPGIISASSPAWGEEGPLAGLPALDPQVQMFSGFVSLNGAAGGRPEMLRYPHLDFNASCHFAISVVLGLLSRQKNGQGQRIIASHLGSAITLLMSRLAEYLATGETPAPMGSASAATAPHQYFWCQDDQYIAVGVETEEQWRGLCAAMQTEDLLGDTRFVSNRERVKNREALIALLEPVFASHPARWWALRLTAQRVPCAFMMDFDRLRFHEQIVENGFITEIAPLHQGKMYVSQVPWELSKTPAAITIDGADRGEHTEEIVARGFGDDAPAPAPPSNSDGVAEPPLAGYRVLDATQGYAGPFAGLLLADAGAEVIKIEPPCGDYSRGFAPEAVRGDSALFAALNRNKRSVVLDLDKEEDRRLYRNMAESMDIVLEDWGPGVAAGLGLGYEHLSVAKPDLVYCALSAYGERGPLRDLPGCELVFQAWSEYWKNLGPIGGHPPRVGADIVGLGTGAMATLGILAALYHRVRTGEGQRVAASMLGTMMCLRTAQWAAVTNPDSWDGTTYCNNQVRGSWSGYMTQDRPIYFNLNNTTEDQYLAILGELEMLDEVIADPRFGNGGRDAVGMGKHTGEVRGIWEKYFQRRPYRDVVAILNRHGASAVEMLYLDEVLDHPQVCTLNLVAEDSEGRSYMRAPWVGPWPSVPVRPPPALDQDKDEVLQALGARS